MKKILSILLSAGIFVFSSAGCAVTEDAVASANEPATSSESMPASEASVDSQSEAEASAIGEEPPDNNWEIDTPKNHGMDSVQWRTDPQGITDGGNGISMTARDAAKFGQLYLDGGKWKERQIIPASWVEQSVKVQYARSGNSGSYGYQWWLRPFGKGNYDTYYAMGHGGQYIFVVPELRLITVITSRFQDTNAPWPYFTDYILAACEQQEAQG